MSSDRYENKILSTTLLWKYIIVIPNPLTELKISNRKTKAIFLIHYCSTDRYKSKCIQCKIIVHKVRHLLDEFKIIKENEIFGICKRCKESCKIKCDRCEYIKNKFVDIYKRRRKERQERFKAWLCKVNQLLQSIIDGEGICQQRVYRDVELERLLQDLKEPLDVRQPDIDFFPSLEEELSSLQGLKDSKILLDELLSKMKPGAEEHAAHSSASEEICIGKDLKVKQFEESQATILTGVPLQDLDTSLSQEECKDLVKRLIVLSQDLPRGIHLNKDLILDLIETIDIATKRGLSVNIVNKLIDQLKELEKSLDYDMFPELDKHVIIALIRDLNDLLAIGSSQTVNKGLLKLLTQLTNLLTTELKKSEGRYKRHGTPAGEGIKQERIPRSVSEEKRYREQTGIDYKTHGTYEIPTKDVGALGGKEIGQKQKKNENKVTTEVRGVRSEPLAERKQLSPEKFKGKIKDKGLTGSHGKELRRDGSLKSSKIPVIKGKDVLLKTGTKISSASSKTIFDKYKLPPIEKTSTQTDNEKIQPVVGKETEISAKSKTRKSLSKISKSALKKSLSKVHSKKMKTYDSGEGLMKSLSKVTNLSKRGLAKQYVSPEDTSKTKVGREEDSFRRDLRYLSKRQVRSTSQTSLSSGTKSKKNILKKLKLLKEKQAQGKTIYSLETAAALEKIKKKKQEEKPKHFESRSRSGMSMTSSQQLKKAKKISETILEKMLHGETTNEKIERKKKAREAKELKRPATVSRISSRAFNLSPKEAKIESPPSSSTSSTSSVVETMVLPDRKLKIPKVMIKGERIVPYEAECMEDLRKSKPPILRTQHILSEHDWVAKGTEPSINYDEMEYSKLSGDGILKYRLSNRHFIEKGWTILPTKKVMRRMNIYRMIPAEPHRDWFRLHRNRQLYYDTGEILASVDSVGRGLWFYRSGPVALEYYDARESHVGQRYVVYSSGEEVEHGRVKPRTIIALFDVQGNGVVYDHKGNVRLKYNQSEGVLVDPTLGPPCKWKWHTLNDPPVLQQVFLSPQLKVRDSMIERIGITERSHDSNPTQRKLQPEMVAIELDKFAKEKTFKLMQKFKKLEIRMKAVKLNEHFALKILDQTTIHLFFRDGTTSLKLNLGMVLISDEIVDTDTAELTDVQTPYDRLPAKSPSVEDIQLFLKTVNLRNQMSHATRA